MLAHRLLSFFTALFIIPAASVPVAGQTDAYSFIHYTTDNGLSNDRVSAIAKDRLGFTWIGTINGLNRFDGRSFRIFHRDPGNDRSLPGSNIFGLTLAPDGRLWVSTDDGLCLLDPQRLAFERVRLPEQADSLHNDQVGNVAFDALGRAWVCGEKTLYCLDGKGRLQAAYPVRTAYAGSWQTFIDHKGLIWLCNGGNMTRFDPFTKTLREFGGPDDRSKVKGAAIMRVAEDGAGTLWVGTWFKGLYRLDRERDEIVPAGTETWLVTGILVDTTYDGRPFFWMGGGQYGLFTYFPDNGQRVEMPGSPLDPHTHNGAMAYTIFKDRASGDVWIGTETGLEYFSPTTVRFGRALVPIEADFSQFSLVSMVVRDRTDPAAQTYFIAVGGTGLFRWNRFDNGFTRFKPENSALLNREIMCIEQDRKGYVWIGLTGGVNRYDPRSGEWRSWTGFFSDPAIANKIMSVRADSKGRLWFGSNKQGLFRYDPASQSIEAVALPAEARDANGRMFISTMTEDKAGRIWLGVNDRAVRYDPESGEVKVVLLGHGSRELGLATTPDGHIWATVHTELLELDDEGHILRRFDGSNGLRCSQLIYVAVDQKGKVWCNSDYLLHCLDPKTGEFTYYGKPDGLFANSMTDALSITTGGEIFIGFQNAFNYFNPEQLRHNTVPPPVTITSVKVLNKETDLFTPLVLLPGENMLSFEFAALNFSQPERNRFAYLLEGFDKEWIYTDRPVAVYTNLDGGGYRFRVKACNNDGIWNETGASFAFRVKPPFYERLVFRLGALLLAGGLAYGVSRYRRLQRERLDAFRERIARDLHDEMGSTLSSIRFFSEFAQTQVAEVKPESVPILQRISQSASALSESMQDIIWAMKSRNDELEDLSSRMTEFGLRMLEARGIRFKTHIPDQFPDRRLAPEQRRNLYLIFKEALNNAAKYSHCTEVELSFMARNNLLLLEISDNGRGFDRSEVNRGNGLHNMRERAAEIGGQLDIRSGEGKGTQVRLRMTI